MIHKSIPLLASAFITSLLVTACGGGGAESAAPQQPVKDGGNTAVIKSSIKGKVIDGYVRGATVWLDINADKIRNADEPSAISGQAGSYILELTEAQRECVAYSTIYVDVPVGAIDEDSGVVTQAYQMSRPPLLAAPTVEDVLNISPLTTVLSEQILEKFSPMGASPRTCNELKANRQLVQDFKYELKALFTNFVQRYNLSEQQIYADFIQTADQASYQLAQVIVKGLKASFSYRQQLKTQHPQASSIRTLFYQDKQSSEPGNWYRETSIWFDSSYNYELVIMSDDLQTVLRPVYVRETKDSSWGSGIYSLSRDRSSYNGTDYVCSAQEAVRFTAQQVQYELNNLSQIQTVSDLALCTEPNFEPASSRYYSISYTKNGINYHTRFTILPSDSEFSALSGWSQLSSKAGILDPQQLINRAEVSGYRFDQEVTLNVYDWYKRSTDDSNGQRIQIERWKDGHWVKLSYKADNTYTKECSIDGVVWVSCRT